MMDFFEMPVNDPQLPAVPTDLLERVEGPGKYEGELKLTEWLDEQDADESFGDVDEGGHYRLYVFDAKIGPYDGGVLRTDGNGFVHGEYFEDAIELRKQWSVYEKQYTDSIEEAAEDRFEWPCVEQARALRDSGEIDTVDEVTDANEDWRGGWLLSCRSREYLVCTEDEADAVWEAALESYLEECVLPEVPEHVRNYFDDEKWKSDARHDGRGHSIATYDGDERDGTDPVSGTTYIIFRMS